MIHGDAKSDRSSEVMQIDEALADPQVVEKLGHGDCEVVERRCLQYVGLTESRQVGCDHVGNFGQGRPNVAKGIR
jgi:hypothetical protein